MMPPAIGLGPLQIPRDRFELLVAVFLLLMFLAWLERREKLAGTPLGVALGEGFVFGGVLGSRILTVVQNPDTWAHPAQWLLLPASVTGLVLGMAAALAVQWRRNKGPLRPVVHLWLAVAVAAVTLMILARGLNTGYRWDFIWAGIGLVWTGHTVWRLGHIDFPLQISAETLWATATLWLLTERFSPYPPFRWTAWHILLAVAAVVGWGVMGLPRWNVRRKNNAS